MQLYSLARSCQGLSLPLTSTASFVYSRPSSAATAHNDYTTARDVGDHPLDGDRPPAAQGQHRYNRCVLGPATSARNTHLTCIRSSRCVRRSGEEEGQSLLSVRGFVWIVATSASGLGTSDARVRGEPISPRSPAVCGTWKTVYCHVCMHYDVRSSAYILHPRVSALHRRYPHHTPGTRNSVLWQRD